MREVGKGYWMINDTLDLAYSEYDEKDCGKGWYFIRFPEQDASQSFETKTEAIKAMESNDLKWGE